jgi:uncharacterized SAM-binding protein YcdF (DUF218 family)
MALFLSKFLPMLFFPLSMACIFIAVSLVAQVRDCSRIAIAANLMALAILGLMGSPPVARLLVRPLEMLDVPSGPLPQADAIVVLGGVTGPAIPPQPTVHLTGAADRLTYAAELYRAHKAALVVLSGGGMPWSRSVPPESALMTDIMQMLGVPRSAILEESSSRNTHENAVYTRRLLLTHNVHRVLLVTSAISMPRALAVFRGQGIDAIAAPTDFRSVHGPSEGGVSQLEADMLKLLPDPGSLVDFSAAMHEYIGLAEYRLAGWI